jgi:hypothetical protein
VVLDLRTDTWNFLLVLRNGVRSVGLSHDGEMLAYATGDSTLEIVRAQTLCGLSSASPLFVSVLIH